MDPLLFQTTGKKPGSTWAKPCLLYILMAFAFRTMNMDPKRNPNPRDFDPMRFANDFQGEHESATNKDPDQRQNWIFGAGRRVCQGMHIAERSLLMGMA